MSPHWAQPRWVSHHMLGFVRLPWPDTAERDFSQVFTAAKEKASATSKAAIVPSRIVALLSSLYLSASGLDATVMKCGVNLSPVQLFPSKALDSLSLSDRAEGTSTIRGHPPKASSPGGLERLHVFSRLEDGGSSARFCLGRNTICIVMVENSNHSPKSPTVPVLEV